ncbi:hypothetical protein [Corynebacterium auriscanis]|uniref:Uncharacterized protein n=1 Tax=Corynebacterium auriscanis TaxID=99807 RepID=A0A0A2DI30_9CORY|nr:hypothetical protein [Corynebacterium auriscanis]KGM18838.1 hypothetical protein MA47_04185 [Corynebacterium auriscanis]
MSNLPSNHDNANIPLPHSGRSRGLGHLPVFASDEKAYDWFKEESKADDSLGWGLEVEREGEWVFLDQSEGGTNTSGSDN